MNFAEAICLKHRMEGVAAAMMKIINDPKASPAVRLQAAKAMLKAIESVVAGEHYIKKAFPVE